MSKIVALVALVLMAMPYGARTYHSCKDLGVNKIAECIGGEWISSLQEARR